MVVGRDVQLQSPFRVSARGAKGRGWGGWEGGGEGYWSHVCGGGLYTFSILGRRFLLFFTFVLPDDRVRKYTLPFFSCAFVEKRKATVGKNRGYRARTSPLEVSLGSGWPFLVDVFVDCRNYWWRSRKRTLENERCRNERFEGEKRGWAGRATER